MAVNVTIRNVPDDVHQELTARAQKAGRSLQELLLEELSALAHRSPNAEALARIEAHKAAAPLRLTPEQILSLRDQDRK